MKKNTNTRIPTYIQALCLTAAMGMGTAHGATLLIDWSKTSPITTDGDGNSWNSLGINSENDRDLTNAALIDSTGAVTAVTVSVDNDPAVSGWGNFAGGTGPDPFDELAVYEDALFNGTTVAMPITFQGLLANTQYTFTAINRRAASGRDGKITISTGTSTDIGTGAVLALNGSVLSFNATSDASGIIALGFAEDTAGAGGAVMNGMTITGTFPIPEPSSASLLAAVGAWGLLRRRRSA